MLKRKNSILINTLLYGILIFFSFLAIAPILFSFSTSFKESYEYISKPLAFPEKLILDNYRFIWLDAGVYRYYINNAIIIVGALSLYLFLSASAGFAFGKLQFKGRKTLFLIFLFIMIFPQMMLASHMFKIMVKLKLNNTYWGYILAWVSYVIPFGVYMMTTYFSGIPRSLLESTRVDGAGIFTILLRIMIPIAKPMMVTLGIMGFLALWNEFTFALLFLQKASMRTVAMGLAMIAGEHGISVPRMAAGLIISSVVPFVFYSLLQKKIAMGSTAGSVKE